MIKKIPYGISDYETLVKKNYLYVDKTRFIELLESLGEPYIFFLRPRRFGKSLFISVLDYYYDINGKKKFEDLFGDTYIGKKPTEEKNSHYILRFDFSGINTCSEKNLIEGFRGKTITGIMNFEKRYNLNIKYEEDKLPSDILEQFFRGVKGEIAGKIYVLIDEYDHFANELLSFNVNLFEETISKAGFVRKWYEVLKSATGSGLVDRMFATGVSPLTLDGLTSGFNISKNKTMDIRFNECLGFTEEEVKLVLEQSLGENIDVEKEMPVLKKYYNGYLFNKNGKKRIFNSDMILYYASEYSGSGLPPEQLIDNNIASDYKKLAMLFYLKNKEQNLEVLKEIIDGKTQNTLITSEFSLAKRFHRDDFNSLLFYLGFLTIEKSRPTSVDLNVPNYVIKELYFDFFGEILRKEADYDIDVSKIRYAIEKIAIEGEIKDFLNIISTTLKNLSNRDFQNFDEKYIKVIMITYLMMSRVYYVKSEVEKNKGYTDIMILGKPGINVPYQGVFEIKYIKKKDFSEKRLKEKVEDAKSQLEKYKNDPELANSNNILKIVVVFCNDEVVYEEIIRV